jgi:hypothetical protein
MITSLQEMLLQGPEKIEQLLNTCSQSITLLEGHNSNEDEIAIGEPRLKFTESYVEKNGKRYYVNEHVEDKKLQMALRLIEEVKPSNVYGDILWIKDDVQELKEDELVYAKYNDNIYVTSQNSTIGNAMRNKVGIVLHEGAVKAPDWAYIVKGKAINGQGKVSWNEKETQVIHDIYHELKTLSEKIVGHPKYRELCNSANVLKKYSITQLRESDDMSTIAKSLLKNMVQLIESNNDLVADISKAQSLISELQSEIRIKLQEAAEFLRLNEDLIVSDVDNKIIKFIDRGVLKEDKGQKNIEDEDFITLAFNTQEEADEAVKEINKEAKDIGLLTERLIEKDDIAKKQVGNWKFTTKKDAAAFLDELKSKYSVNSYKAELSGSSPKFYVEVKKIDKDKGNTEVKAQTVKAKEVKKPEEKVSSTSEDPQDELVRYMKFIESKHLTSREMQFFGRKDKSNFSKTMSYFKISNGKIDYMYILRKDPSTTKNTSDLQQLDFGTEEGLRIIKKLTDGLEYSEKIPPKINGLYSTSCYSIANKDKGYNIYIKGEPAAFKFYFTKEILYKPGGEKNCGEMFENVLSYELALLSSTQTLEKQLFTKETQVLNKQKLQSAYSDYAKDAVTFMALKKFLHKSDYEEKDGVYFTSPAFKMKVKNTFYKLKGNDNIKIVRQCGANETHRGIDWNDSSLLPGAGLNQSVGEAIADIQIVMSSGEIKNVSVKSGPSHGIGTFGFGKDSSDPDVNFPAKDTAINVKTDNILKFLKKIFGTNNEYASEIFNNMKYSIQYYKNPDMKDKKIPNKIILSEEIFKNNKKNYIQEFLKKTIGDNYYIIHYTDAGGGQMNIEYLEEKIVDELIKKYFEGSIGIRYPNFSSKACEIFLNYDKGSYRAVDKSPFGKIKIVFMATGEQNLTINSFNSIEIKAAHSAVKEDSILTFEDLILLQ